MKITQDSLVQIHYTVKTKEGELIDQSEKDDPFSFVFGKDEMIDGVEKALRGREQGESLHIELSPADAYGEHDPELRQTLSKKHIEGLEEVEVGMQLQSETEDGETITATVVDISEDEVTIDTNHQLAGISLVFDIEILEVSAAKSTS